MLKHKHHISYNDEILRFDQSNMKCNIVILNILQIMEISIVSLAIMNYPIKRMKEFQFIFLLLLIHLLLLNLDAFFYK